MERFPIALSLVKAAGLAAALLWCALLPSMGLGFALHAQESMASPAADLVTLAHQQHVQGNYAQAEVLLTRALAMDVKALGPDSPEVGSILNNLG